ncbi:MAG: hypothetical protein HN337_05870 [Deltaproteobacteria bacterium]|jgi:hypothetical protein|nr:hypothetical protein [Deltaproteobacteria bacterium]
MAGDPIYLKDGCTLYRCKEAEGGEYTCDETYQCESAMPGADAACSFKKTDEVEYKVVKGDDGSIAIVNDTYGTVEGKLDSLPPSRVLSMPDILSRGVLKSVSRFDFDLLQKSWNVCNTDTGMPISVKLSDGPKGAEGFGTALITRSDKKAIPVFTISGKGSTKQALTLTKWLQAKLQQRKSEIMQDSKVVIVYYPPKMEKEALEVAGEYIAQGTYAMPIKLEEKPIYKYREGASGDIITVASKKLTKARKKTLTIAYLPTEGMDIPKWRSDDPNERISQNNEMVGRLIEKALGHFSTGEMYGHYLSAVGLSVEKVEVTDFGEG